MDGDEMDIPDGIIPAMASAEGSEEDDEEIDPVVLETARFTSVVSPPIGQLLMPQVIIIATCTCIYLKGL